MPRCRQSVGDPHLIGLSLSCSMIGRDRPERRSRCWNLAYEIYSAVCECVVCVGVCGCGERMIRATKYMF